MHLDKFVPVGGWASSGRERRRFERFAEMCQWLTSRGRSHPGLLPLANLSRRVSRLLPAVSSEPDVAAARWALERKLLPHPGHQFRPDNSRGVVRAGLFMSVAAAFHGKRVAHTRDAAVGVADQGEPLECKRGPSTVPQEMLERLKVARHVAVY